jgi:hypothetical protein
MEDALKSYQRYWDSINKKYPVGGEFEYLGRKMIIKKNFYSCGWLSSFRITANYADDHGEIHEIIFNENEVKAMATQPSNAKTARPNKQKKV